MSTTSQRLYIFEGPDGAGKTTAARQLAAVVGARYVHLGPFLQVHNLGRLYAEAMLPALLGYQPVVLDRSWLSETPYGRYHRGQVRLDEVDQRMLERLALRCAPLLIRCLPPWEVVRRSFNQRLRTEYLDGEKTLRQIYTWYRLLTPGLPYVTYDYTVEPEPQLLLGKGGLVPHPTAVSSAGASGGVLLVGEAFAEVQDADMLYQYPFVSFAQQGCSRWLAQQLSKAGITEHQLCWVNADQDLQAAITALRPTSIISLGTVAAVRLDQLGQAHQAVEHPQHWKRFNHRRPYPLLQLLRRLL